MKLNSNQDIKLLLDLCIVEEMKYLGKAQYNINNSEQQKAARNRKKSAQFDDLKAYILGHAQSRRISFSSLRREFQEDKLICQFLDKLENTMPSVLNRRAYNFLINLQQSNNFPKNFDEDISERFANSKITSARALCRSTLQSLSENKTVYRKEFAGRVAAIALTGAALVSIAHAKTVSGAETHQSSSSFSEEAQTKNDNPPAPTINTEKYNKYIDLLTQFQNSANAPDIAENFDELQDQALDIVKTFFIDNYNEKNGTSYSINDYELHYSFEKGDGNYAFSATTNDGVVLEIYSSSALLNLFKDTSFKDMDKLLNAFTSVFGANSYDKKTVDRFIQTFGDTISDSFTQDVDDQLDYDK